MDPDIFKPDLPQPSFDISDHSGSGDTTGVELEIHPNLPGQFLQGNDV
jgi:hypothetical protein